MTGLSIAQIEAWRAGDVREVSTPPAASPRPPYVHASRVVVYVAVSFDKPFPDDVWPAALDIVTAGATRLGITDRGKLIDSAGHRDISITGHGGVVQFATYKASTLTAQSDCRIRETPQ